MGIHTYRWSKTIWAHRGIQIYRRSRRRRRPSPRTGRLNRSQPGAPPDKNTQSSSHIFFDSFIVRFVSFENKATSEMWAKERKKTKITKNIVVDREWNSRSTHDLKASCVASTFEGWQTMTARLWSLLNNFLTYNSPTRRKSDSVTRITASNTSLEKERKRKKEERENNSRPCL